MKNLINLIGNLNKSFGGVSFVNVRNYSSKSKQYSTLQDILINVGASSKNAKEFDAKLIESISNEKLSELLIIVNKSDVRVTIETMQEAKNAMVKSMRNPDKARSEAQINAGQNLTANGSLKYYSETDKINIEGLVVRRSNFRIVDVEVYEAIILKEANVNSRALTVAKKSIEKLIKDEKKYNYMRLTVSQSQFVALQGDVLDFDYSIESKK